MPDPSHITLVKPRLGVDSVFPRILTAHQENTGLSQLPCAWRPGLTFPHVSPSWGSGSKSGHSWDTASSIGKYFYLLLNKLLYNIHTALIAPGTLGSILLLLLLLSTRTLAICRLRAYLNDSFLFPSHRKEPCTWQVLNKYFFINVITEMYLKFLNSSVSQIN